MQKERLLQHCGYFRTLRRVIVMVAGALDGGRIGGFERQHAMLCQICRILEPGAKDNGHDLVWGWPLLGLSDARPDVHWSSAEHWQGNAQCQERAPLRRRRQFAKTDSRRGKADPSSETARTGRQGRKGQRRRGKLRLGRDLHEAGPARLRDRSQCFPTHQNGWPMFFLHCCPPLPRKRSSRNLSARRSPQLVPSTTLGGVGSRRQPAHAIARAATATKHEPGLSPSCRVVSYGSALEV